MPLVKTKPTSAGRRFVVKVVNPELHKGKPHKGLIAKKSKTGGRNNAGRITSRNSWSATGLRCIGSQRRPVPTGSCSPGGPWVDEWERTWQPNATTWPG